MVNFQETYYAPKSISIPNADGIVPSSIVVFISSLIFGGDYFYRDYTNKQLQQEIKTIKNRLDKKNRELSVLRAKNQAILEEVTKYEKQIGEIQTKIDFIRDVLKTSFNYLDLPKTNKDFLLLSKLLQKYKLETVLITYKENQFFTDNTFKII